MLRPLDTGFNAYCLKMKLLIEAANDSATCPARSRVGTHHQLSVLRISVLTARSHNCRQGMQNFSINRFKALTVDSDSSTRHREQAHPPKRASRDCTPAAVKRHVYGLHYEEVDKRTQ